LGPSPIPGPALSAATRWPPCWRSPLLRFSPSARSVTAIAEWAADAPQPARAALGARRDPRTGRWVVPTETTIRRTLARLDAEALAAAIGGWLADRKRPNQRRPAVAVDGKTLRGKITLLDYPG
jgi:hypothetical protein